MNLCEAMGFLPITMSACFPYILTFMFLNQLFPTNMCFKFQVIPVSGSKDMVFDTWEKRQNFCILA